LQCRRFGSIANSGLLGDARLENTPEVGDPEKKDHQQRENERELDEGLSARSGPAEVSPEADRWPQMNVPPGRVSQCLLPWWPLPSYYSTSRTFVVAER